MTQLLRHDFRVDCFYQVLETVADDGNIHYIEVESQKDDFHGRDPVDGS